MRETAILISLAVVLGAYLFLSRREANYVNVLVPVVLFGVPSWYLLELAYDEIFGYAGSTYAYVYCYATYACGVLATLAGYLLGPTRALPIFIKVPNLRVWGAPLWALGVGVALYMEVLAHFPDLLTSPRQLYQLTRTGFGIQFFLSTFAIYFALVLLLFGRRPRPFVFGTFVAVSLALLYLHGSKGEVLYFLLIGLYFSVFVRGRRYGLRRMAGLGLGVSMTILALFYAVMSPAERQDFVVSIVSYADYTRNAAVVIDDPDKSYQFGRLTAEGSFYALVPRAFFPQKPRDFGALWLAERYFPERYEAAHGAPDFGLGLQYMDFGPFAIVYWALTALVKGLVLKVLVTRLRLQPDAGTFLLLLVLMDVPLIPIGGGGPPFLAYYLLAHVAKSLRPNLAEETLPANQPGTLNPIAIRNS